MTFADLGRDRHPYLSGNFAPIHQTRSLTPCSYSGHIPNELAGGQYVRNGGNPFSNDDLARDAHWFDGDGMVSGVAFQRRPEVDGEIVPEFVNHFILTDCLLASISSPTLLSPILPSIATLVNPASSLVKIILRVFRTLLLVLLSHLPGSKQPIKKISVANTAVYFHDGRALASCESGPPMRIQLPGLETVGWYNGHEAEGEHSVKSVEPGFGGEGLLSFMKEWTTGHPKIDPMTKELIVYHCTFIAPYVHYSVIPSASSLRQEKILNAPVPGMSGAKMIHDFGASHHHTVMMDLPLSLDPFNLMKNKSVVAYDSSKPSRFGVFPRYDPSSVRWFETAACCIFHTANTWDDQDSQGNTEAVNMMACRLTSATLVFSAGNIAAPQPTRKTVEEVKKAMPFFEKYDYDRCLHQVDGESKAEDEISHYGSCFSDYAFERARALESTELETSPLISPGAHSVDPDVEEDQCRLYYYRFDMSPNTDSVDSAITHQFALSAIPFEFPTLNPAKEMSSAHYIYGCSVLTSSFGAALGKAAKIDVIAKIDALQLISRGMNKPPRAVTGCVDTRNIAQVLLDNAVNPDDPVRCFRMPLGWYAQEARFVSYENPTSEDDGFLLFYAFDESQLDSDGECPSNATSELWVLDARDMQKIICRIKLPQRVPYGLHGNWFTEKQIEAQREVKKFREIPAVKPEGQGTFAENVRNRMIGMLG
ncbi:carotenoid oxygenase [Venturia nashicola]|uniref:Carotenoid oxygenase n=1 Tax=Venturia nashicola TaxID=86259 RepID=A0A4Z1NT24_9PEZI|nr:carotenoid oxygenase [Venturia nashicola]